MAAPDGDLTLLHVVDEEFIQAAVAAGMGTTDDLRARLKEQAEASFANVLEGIETGTVDIEKMIVVGLPFVEILKIARDLDLPMIVGPLPHGDGVTLERAYLDAIAAADPAHDLHTASLVVVLRADCSTKCSVTRADMNAWLGCGCSSIAAHSSPWPRD
jgi:hypothetical protein